MLQQRRFQMWTKAIQASSKLQQQITCSSLPHPSLRDTFSPQAVRRENEGRCLEGFTLIELVITMAIISILASIAYPSYLDYITRLRRHDGQTALLELANQMEQYYANNNTYKTATIATGNSSDIQSSNTTPEGWYRLIITEQSDTNYTLQATAINAQAKNDEPCQHLTFNSIGEKGPAKGSDESSKGALSRCW